MGKQKESLESSEKISGIELKKRATRYWDEEEERQVAIFGQSLVQKIREFRMGQGWSQVQMAELMGVNQQDVSKMESSEGNLSAMQLYKLKALGMPVERFFDAYEGSKDPVACAFEIGKDLWESGMIAVYPTRRAGLQSLMSNILHERLGIHIVGSSLKGLIMDRVFLDAIERRVRAGVDLKMLIGHPAFAALRAWVEGRQAESISLEIDETISNYCKKLRKLATKDKQVQIRVALHPPTIFSIFLVSQQRALINPYSLTIEAYNTACFLIARTQKRDCMFEQYHEHHFENAWDCERRLGREVTIDLEDERMKPDRLNQAKIKFEEALNSVVKPVPER